MAEGTGARLDTVDIADGSGWQVESTDEADVFTKGAVTIEVRYSANDAVESAVKRAANGDVERITNAKHDVLRAWLAGRVPVSAEIPKPVHSDESRVPKLRWSRENWLHKPTQEVADNSDPRVPRTVDAAKKQSKIWYLIGSQANVDGGCYRREMDMNTAAAGEPTYTATWNPINGPAELLTRGTGGQAYWACVRHYQANYSA
ncbi:hypothetical protein [Mycobacterium colombiense]|uniref:hypothetical protein n=1 Tax=Mycobacterium colombiense TaxID=339268 RepID=UPI000A8A2609|nr:hypothetical protein [Mycobacterium colombiense]